MLADLPPWVGIKGTGEIDADDLDRMLDSLLETSAYPSAPVAIVER